MATHDWQLQTPLSAIIFDCDGTMSAIEGIDELARKKGVYKEVASLTEKAMGVSGMNPELYQERLRLVNPKRDDVLHLGDEYFARQVDDVHAVIQVLQRLNKSIYIVSAGLHPAVLSFGAKLQIPADNIFAVDIYFDSEGNFLDFDHDSPLTQRNGKYDIAQKLLRHHESILHIGDGLNDFATKQIVTRFVGYGGVFYREHLARDCKYYIRTLSLAPLLPLALTQEESELLLEEEAALYEKGLNHIQLSVKE